MAEFMTGFTRTHYCGELRLSDVGKEEPCAVGYSVNVIWDN